MGKYKNAYKKEMEWLDEEIDILNKMIEGTETDSKIYSKSNLALMHHIAVKERARLIIWLKEEGDNND